MVEIKTLKIKADSRSIILFEKFGFVPRGFVNITVSNVTFSSTLASPDATLFGFFLLSDESLIQATHESQQHQEQNSNPNPNPNPGCILSSHYVRLLFKFNELEAPNYNSFTNYFPKSLRVASASPPSPLPPSSSPSPTAAPTLTGPLFAPPPTSPLTTPSTFATSASSATSAPATSPASTTAASVASMPQNPPPQSPTSPSRSSTSTPSPTQVASPPRTLATAGSFLTCESRPACWRSWITLAVPGGNFF